MKLMVVGGGVFVRLSSGVAAGIVSRGGTRDTRAAEHGRFRVCLSLSVQGDAGYAWDCRGLGILDCYLEGERLSIVLGVTGAYRRKNVS